MLTHYSQVQLSDIPDGEVEPETAGQIAEALGLEAFFCDESQQWFLFDRSDPETETPETVEWLRLSPESYSALLNFFKNE